MAYFSKDTYDKYKNPTIVEPPVQGAQPVYNPSDVTQKNPYLDVDSNQLQNMYNHELNILESDNTRVAPSQDIGPDGQFIKYRGGKESDYGDSFWMGTLEQDKADYAKTYKNGGTLNSYHDGGEVEEHPHVFRNGKKVDKSVVDMIETGDETNLSFLPPDLKSKHPEVYEKLMNMDEGTKSSMSNYFSQTVDSARENVKGVSSGMAWFAELDVEPVKDILTKAKIEKSDFRNVVKDYAESKANNAGEDFGLMAKTALTGAMALKGLKRGGELPKKVEGGGLTEGQQSTVNWANMASTAANTAVEVTTPSAVFGKADPYSTATRKETRRAGMGERAKKGASIGGTAGAAIGSVIPIVGTAVGAAVGTAIGTIVGGISGFFGGNKQYEKNEAAVDKREGEELVNTIGLGNQISEGISQKNSMASTTDYLEELSGNTTGPYSSHKRGGMVYGPRHESGGVMAVKNGKPIAEVEGDEYIINNDIIKDKKESKQRFKVEGTPAQIASALNSYKGYGDNTNPGGNIYKIG